MSNRVDDLGHAITKPGFRSNFQYCYAENPTTGILIKLNTGIFIFREILILSKLQFCQTFYTLSSLSKSQS